jgi:pimeloyl-ACP methyl ester carboxylesterase
MLTRLAHLSLMCLLAATTLAACANTSTGQTPSSVSGPHFTDDGANCPWDLAETRARLPGMALHCGVVDVPEFHALPDGLRLHLAVMVAQRDPAHPSADAVIYLAGGPGNRAEPGSLADFAASGRDVIVFDQRGVGYSAPALNCPAVGSRDPITAAVERAATLAGCRDELVRQGAHLAAYSIPEDAADVDTIRQALGYQQLDLYGLSYGTKVALAVMRDFPQTLRSAVLDSVLPMQANVVADLPGNIQRALNLVFAACAADPACSQVRPNLKSDFSELLTQLDARPASLTLIGANVPFSGASLTQLLLALLIEGPQRLPDLIERARDGDLGGLAQIIDDMRTPSTQTAWVMSFSVVCSDGNLGASSTPGLAAESVAAELREPLRAGSQAVVTLCQNWPVSKLAADSAQPVRSDIPTLVLEGTFDPITPPAYGQLAAQTLGRSFYVEFPDRGHAVMRGDNCSQQIVNEFFKQPAAAPEAQCAATLRPTFDAAPNGPPGKIGFAISRGDILSAAASALRLTAGEVEQYLGAGHSLAELAAAQQVPRQQLRDAILSAVQKEIEAQVQTGSLSAADGKQVLHKFEQGSLDQILDDKPPPGN